MCGPTHSTTIYPGYVTFVAKNTFRPGQLLMNGRTRERFPFLFLFRSPVFFFCFREVAGQSTSTAAYGLVITILVSRVQRRRIVMFPSVNRDTHRAECYLYVAGGFTNAISQNMYFVRGKTDNFTACATIVLRRISLRLESRVGILRIHRRIALSWKGKQSARRPEAEFVRSASRNHADRATAATRLKFEARPGRAIGGA